MASETNDKKIVKNPTHRIWYVDPNDVYGMSNDIPVTPDYTDLCISFDLQVETVPRTGYIRGIKNDDGNNKSNGVTETYHFFWTSYMANADGKSNYVSFTKGEEYLDRSYLTTYYTDINFNDFRNKDVIEGLGVESVNISFESYYTPTIKMRFVDVRGASLFGREEAIHTEGKITQDNIWGCFFTFPYPKFRLQVKGFYGEPVTYQLTCLDFRANFDSKVGSFIIDVTFVGYDYGVMSDIPTAYLIAAPYSTYVGMDYWNTQKNSERWRLTDGQPPTTLKEIRDKIKAAIRVAETTENGEKLNEGNDGSEVADNLKKLNELKGVITAYNEVVGCLLKKGELSGQPIVKDLYKLEYDDNLYYFFRKLPNIKWKEIVNKSSIFYDKVSKFKASFPVESALLDDSVLLFGRKITTDEKVGKQNENGTILTNNNTTNEEKYTTEDVYSFFCSSIMSEIFPVTNLTQDNLPGGKAMSWNTSNIKNIEYYDKIVGDFQPFSGGYKGMLLGNKAGYQVIPVLKTSKNLQLLKSQFESGITEQNEVSYQEYEETSSYMSRLNIYQAAGLLPTIENVFKTIMCHLETFMQMVYECKTRIDNQMTAGDRTPQKLGIEGYTFQDYKAGKTSDADDSVINIPPWIAVSVEEPKNATSVIENDYVHTIGWVGDFEGEVEWEEAKLIDGLSLAWSKSAPKPDVIKESYYGTATILCLPTDIYSDIFPEAAVNNPLALGQYLATRVASMFGVVGYLSDAAEALGKADAVNMLAKVGVEHIRKTFTNASNASDWKKVFKEAPLKQYEEGNYVIERIYANGPGCEGKNRIYTEENSGGKYRYCYTEAVVNNEKFGMVYIPEADESSVLGDENSVFFKEVKFPDSGNTNKAIVKVRANLKYKSDEEKNECKTGRIYYKSSTDKFLNINGGTDDSCKKTFHDEAMFGIYGGLVGEMSETYHEKIVKASLSLTEQKLVVEEYEDTDTTWREKIHAYWAIEEPYNYVIEGIDEKKYCWTILNGNSYRTNKEPQFIFHSREYYIQNNPRETDTAGVTSDDAFSRRAAKCLLVLSSAGYDIERTVLAFNKKVKLHIFSGVEYGAILLLGGLLWRAMQPKDCIVWEYQGGLNYDINDEHKINSTLSLENIGKKAWVLTNTRYYNATYVNPTQQEYFKINPEDFDINVRNRLIEEFKTYVSDETSRGWGALMKDFEILDKENSVITTNYGEYARVFGDSEQNERFGTKEKKEEFLKNERERMWNNPHFANLTRYVVVTYGSLNPPDDVNTSVTIDKSCWEAYADAFCSKLEEIANYKTEYTDATPIQEKHRDTDLKRAMYMYIKRLWDRWFMMASPEQFKVENYMQNFVFMDSFYRNIGSVLHINCERLYEGLMDVRGESMLYQLLSKICTDHHCHFFAFPDYFGFGDDKLEQKNAKNKNMTPDEKLKHLFTPIPFSKKEKLETSNKYVVALVYDQSENITDFNDYTKDDFDIYGYNDASLIYPETFNVLPISEELDQPGVSSEERRTKRYGYNIPSFGVTFGRQNNHIFKNVNIGMSNPIATEQSINALSLIAERGGGTEKAICFYGQDLYPVYNGYSYDCTVEMMGDVQIMPLMYFQLLNMPMFRGTYMIYSVTHTMRPGDMTTTFKGMKLSKFALPFAKGWYTNSRMYVANDGTLLPGEYIDGCNEYGNVELKLTKNQKTLLISDNRGITKNMYTDTYTLLNSWQTKIEVQVHTDSFVDGKQGYKYISLEINKFIVDKVTKIFQEIFNTTIGGKYFAITSLYGYNDNPQKRRTINNPKYPNSKTLSYHAYGVAIDINAKLNWWYTKEGTDDYLHIRTENHPVVQIFKKYDWGWGGRYGDYMHFSYFNGS